MDPTDRPAEAAVHEPGRARCKAEVCADARELMDQLTDTMAERLFANLVSTSATTSGAAAAALADLLEEQHSTEHHRRVGELIASAKPHEQAGGLAARPCAAAHRRRGAWAAALHVCCTAAYGAASRGWRSGCAECGV